LQAFHLFFNFLHNSKLMTMRPYVPVQTLASCWRPQQYDCVSDVGNMIFRDVMKILRHYRIRCNCNARTADDAPRSRAHLFQKFINAERLDRNAVPTQPICQCLCGRQIRYFDKFTLGEPSNKSTPLSPPAICPSPCLLNIGIPLRISLPPPCPDRRPQIHHKGEDVQRE
jgi:hypothetical protein